MDWSMASAVTLDCMTGRKPKRWVYLEKLCEKSHELPDGLLTLYFASTRFGDLTNFNRPQLSNPWKQPEDVTRAKVTTLGPRRNRQQLPLAR